MSASNERLDAEAHELGLSLVAVEGGFGRYTFRYRLYDETDKLVWGAFTLAEIDAKLRRLRQREEDGLQ